MKTTDLLNARFVTKQYEIELEAELTKKINYIEENTEDNLYTYLGDLADVDSFEIDGMDVDSFEIDGMNDATVIYIDFNVDLPYEIVMDRVAKCIDMFIKENE